MLPADHINSPAANASASVWRVLLLPTRQSF